MRREGVGLDRLKVVGRELRLLQEEVRDPLGAVRLRVLEGNERCPVSRRRTIVRGHDEVRRRIQDVGEIIEADPTKPLGFTCPSPGRLRSVAARPSRNPAGRVVTDVPLRICVDEVL